MAQSIIEKTGAQVIDNTYVIDYSSLNTLKNFTGLTVIHIVNYGQDNEQKVTLSETTDYTLDTNLLTVTINSTSVTISATNDRVAILRTTSVTTPAVAFSDTALLTDTDLNTAVQQSVFRLQELNEQSSDGYDTSSLAIGQQVQQSLNAVNAVTGEGWVVNSRIADEAVTTGKIANGTIRGEDLDINSIRSIIANIIYPVGSIYANYSDSVNPSALFGIGTWTRISGKVLVGYEAGDTEFGGLGNTGGTKTHTLTSTESGVGEHAHVVYVSGQGGGPSKSFTISSGGRMYHENKGHTASTSQVGIKTGEASEQSQGAEQPHNNLQPYVVVNLWYRTA